LKKKKGRRERGKEKGGKRKGRREKKIKGKRECVCDTTRLVLSRLGACVG
jgi:hypothetical protein